MKKLFLIALFVMLAGAEAFAQSVTSYIPKDKNGKNTNVDFYLGVAKGNVPGHSIMSKFGQNDALNASTYEDIWDGGGVYPYPADSYAPMAEILSTDVDSMSVEVQGLSINGTLTVQTVTLTGTTAITLTTPLWRVFRIKNMGNEDNVGVIKVENAANDTIYAQIAIGNNQTLMALYTVPLGYTGYLLQGTNSLIGVNRTYTVNGKMSMRPYGGVFQLKKTFGLSADGSSFMVLPHPLPGAIAAKTDIRVRAISSATGGMNTTFEILLVEDGY